MFRLFLGLLLATAPASPTTHPATIDVAAGLAQLRKEPMPPQGRGPLVAAYEELISQAGDDPLAVDAMMDLGALWEVRDERHHISPNKSEALRWYRRAADTAATSSPLWAKSRFRIVWLIEATDTDQARKILDDIANQTRGQPVPQAEVESTLLTISLQEGKLDEAEQHARTLFGWYDTAVNIPSDDEGKAAIDAMISQAAGAIVDAVSGDSKSADVRVGRIRRMMDDFPTLQPLQAAGQSAIDEIHKSQ